MSKGTFGGSGRDEMVGLVSEVVDEGDEAGGYADGEDYGPEVVHGIAGYLVLCSMVGQGQYIPVDPMDVVLVVRGVLAQRLETAFPRCRKRTNVVNALSNNSSSGITTSSSIGHENASSALIRLTPSRSSGPYPSITLNGGSVALPFLPHVSFLPRNHSALPPSSQYSSKHKYSDAALSLLSHDAIFFEPAPVSLNFT